MDQRFSSLRAALFDLDGTLVRTFIDFSEMRARMQQISTAYGTGELTSGIGDSLEIVSAMATGLPKSVAVRARQEAFAAIEAIEATGCMSPEEIPAVSELLVLCREQGMKIAVVTRNSRRIALQLLARMTLDHDALVAREDTAEFKPHPAPILEACAQLGVPPDEAMMVGDFWPDIASAKAAGVAVTVGIHWSYDPPDRFAACPPDVLVAEPAALLPLMSVPAKPP